MSRKTSTPTREVRVPDKMQTFGQGIGSSDKDKRIKYLSEKNADLERELDEKIKESDIKFNVEIAKARKELSGDLTRVSEENAKLNLKNTGVLREIKKCNTEKKQLEESITKIRIELKEEKEAKRELEASETKLKQKITELEGKKVEVTVYQGYADEIKRLKLQIELLTKNIQKKETTLAGKDAEIVRLEDLINRYKEDVKRQSLVIFKAQKNLESVRKEQKEQKEECEGVKALMNEKLVETIIEKEVLNKRFKRLDETSLNTIKILTDANKTLEEETKRLKTQKASHETILEKLEKEKANFDSQISDLNQQLKNAEKLRKEEKGGSADVIEKLRKNVDKITRDKTTLDSELKKTEKEIKLASSKIDRLNEQIKSKEYLNTQLDKELNKVRKELEESKEKYTTVSKDLSDLQREYKTLESQNKLTSSELRVYKSKEGNLYVELNQQLDSLKQSNARLLKLQSELEFQLRTCNSDSIQKDAMIKELQKEKEALQKAKDACEKEKVARISKLNTAKLDLEGKLAKITLEKENMDSEIRNTKVNEQRLLEYQKEAEAQIKGIDTDIMKIKSEYESRIQSLSLDIDSKEAMILRLKTELQESRANLKTCNSSNDTLKKENNELIRVRNELQGKLEECNQRYNENQKTIQTLQKQKEYTESRLSSQSSGEMDLLESQSLLKDQIKRLESQISELNREQEQLKTLKSGLETQLQTCNSSNTTLQRENEKLEGRLQASEFSLKTEREESLRLLERIKELDLARKDAEEVNKSIENDRIELQKGITSKHVEIQRLERELDSLKRKLTEIENNPAADFDSYNQGMEEAKQNYIQQIQELQSRISGFDTEKKRMEIQLEECTKVRLELSSKINDLEKLVENLKLENEKLKVENANLVKQVKDQEVGSVKLNEKLKVENQKLIKEREMYSSQFQQTQKLQADNTRYEEIVKSLQEKLQSEILKNRGEKSVIENEYRQSLETIEELNKQLENCKKLLSENSFKLLQSQQIQASQASQASQDKIKELENINNLLREEITKISEQLRLKNSEISREGSSRILEIKNEEERLTGILKRLNTEIGFSEHQLRQIQENISKKKDISVVSSFNTSINDEEYDRIQRIIKNVERVTKKCDKLSESKMSK